MRLEPDSREDSGANLTGRVSRVVRPILARQGVELVEVCYLREQGSWVLRIFIDKPGGVSLDDCVQVSRSIEDVLDVEDMIPHRYRLEVSSPGLDRVLKTESDFQRFCGRRARIQTLRPLEGRKNFKGRILACDQGVVTLQDAQGSVFRIPLAWVAKSRLEIDLTP